MIIERKMPYEMRRMYSWMIVVLISLVALANAFFIHSDLGLSCLYIFMVILLLEETASAKTVLLIGSGCVVAVSAFLYYVDYFQEAKTLLAVSVVDILALIAVWHIAERRRRHAEHRSDLLNIVENTYDGIFIRDSEDVITYWSKGAENLYGWSERDARGKVAGDLFKTIFPETKAVSTSNFLRDDKWEGELSHLSKAGTRIVVLSRWLLLRDQKGRPLATVEANRDITTDHNHRGDLRRASQLITNDLRKAMLAQMTSSIAHELSQPLSASIISSEASLRWLKTDSGNIEEARSAVQSVVANARRAGDVVANVRHLAERETAVCDPLALGVVLQRALSISQDVLLQHEAEPELLVVDWLPEVRGNKNLLEKILADLLVYVVESWPVDVADRRLPIALRMHRTDFGTDEILLDIGSRHTIDTHDVVAVTSDHRKELPNDHIGSPLSVCRFVIESHSWRLDAFSDCSLGVAFRIRIPAKEGPKHYAE